MEINTWITKDEPFNQVAACAGSGVFNNGGGMTSYNPALFVDQQQQQRSQKLLYHYQQLPQQRGYDDGDAFDDQDCLDNAPFCLDDFFAINNNCEQAAQPRVKMENTQQIMSSLHVRTDGAGWMDTATYGGGGGGESDHCQSPDSGVNVDASGASPNSDFGRAYSESPPSSTEDLASPRSVSSAGCGGIGGDQGANWAASEVGLEIYHDLIMRHLVQDIKATCVRLSIPQDPQSWTPSHCRSWLTDMAEQYHLAQVPYENFDVSGATLCSMTLAHFIQRFPNGGETVHAQLQIWNSAKEYCKRQGPNCGTTITTGNGDLAIDSSSTSAAAATIADKMFFPSFQQPQSAVVDHQLLQQQQQHLYSSMNENNHYGQVDHVANAGYSLSALLPSPGSCSDSGMWNDYESPEEPCSPSMTTNRNAAAPNSNNIHLWQFLRELLEQQEKYSHCVRWIDHSAGIFKIEDSHKLAKIWGQRKNRPAMNYDKLSRSLRQYYKKGILKKTARSQRLVYQFLHPFQMC